LKFIISFLIRKIPRRFLQRVSSFLLSSLRIFYTGNKVECPICGKRFRKFFPYGRKPVRDNALCLNCLSLERHRLLWLYLKERTGFFNQKIKLLHIAPEACFISRFESLPNLEYISADLESPLAKIRMDVHNIPFENDCFDTVICNHVMEHVEKDIESMKEIRRVLKPGGWAIIQSPIMGPELEKTYEDPRIIKPHEREKAYGQSDHLRLYGKDYPDRLRSAGFSVTEDDFVKSMPEEQVLRFALPPGEIIYFCEKR
jgi:SAM-dependent methyltransferase